MVVVVVEEEEEVVEGGGLCQVKRFQFVYTNGEPPFFLFVPPFFDSNEQPRTGRHCNTRDTGRNG